MRAPTRRSVAVVLGSAELASAIAIRLDAIGLAVVLCDEVDPRCMRRGMSFTDAWYVGTALLQETHATFCASVRSIPTVLSGRAAVAATTWSWKGVACALEASIVVDARWNAAAAPIDLAAGVAERTLTIAVAPRKALASKARFVIRPAAADIALLEASDGWDPVLAEPFRQVARAPTTGRFMTTRRIGEFVLAGEPIGLIGMDRIVAPASGVLSGLCARGVRVEDAAPVAEVDTRGEAARCFGVPDWCRSLATESVERVVRTRAVQIAPPDTDGDMPPARPEDDARNGSVAADVLDVQGESRGLESFQG